MSPNMKAFLDTLAYSEIGPKLLAVSDDGYNVIVGSTPDAPRLFADYSRHPQEEQPDMNSDAAGRYQFMGRYWEHYKAQLDLPDFGHDSQDLWAIQLIHECHAQDDVEAGNVASAIDKCRSRWASLPGANYPGQHMNAMADLVDAFAALGGVANPNA